MKKLLFYAFLAFVLFDAVGFVVFFICT